MYLKDEERKIFLHVWFKRLVHRIFSQPLSYSSPPKTFLKWSQVNFCSVFPEDLSTTLQESLSILSFCSWWDSDFLLASQSFSSDFCNPFLTDRLLFYWFWNVFDVTFWGLSAVRYTLFELFITLADQVINRRHKIEFSLLKKKKSITLVTVNSQLLIFTFYKSAGSVLTDCFPWKMKSPFENCFCIYPCYCCWKWTFDLKHSSQKKRGLASFPRNVISFFSFFYRTF